MYSMKHIQNMFNNQKAYKHTQVNYKEVVYNKETAQ